MNANYAKAAAKLAVGGLTHLQRLRRVTTEANILLERRRRRELNCGANIFENEAVNA
jgi:hypothetical protein